MSVVIRSAQPDDAAAVARVHVDSWRGAYRGLLPDRILDGLSVSGREILWRQRLGSGEGAPTTLAAVLDGEVGGFVTLLDQARDSGESAGVGEIPALYVSPSHWGSGAGSALLDAAGRELAAAGCRQAILWMLAGNERAERFYTGRGWTDDGGRRSSQYFPEEPDLREVRFRKPL